MDRPDYVTKVAWRISGLLDQIKELEDKNNKLAEEVKELRNNAPEDIGINPIWVRR